MNEVLAVLDDNPAVRQDIGLDVGCGSGRNYLPLVDRGLRVYGLDLSLEALRQLAARRTRLPLICGDFCGFTRGSGLGYVVAIQVFQNYSRIEVR